MALPDANRPKTYDLVVIGAGTAARVGAMRGRAAGKSVAIVDCRPQGGTCALRGCDPKKMLISGASAVDHVRRMHANGVAGDVAIEWPDLMRFKRSFTDPVPEKHEQRLITNEGFLGLEQLPRRMVLGCDRIPDETTILNFRHLLERHGLTEAIFAAVNAHLADRGVSVRSGTLVDATIIDAPSSTKNKAKARDPEMSSTKKGNEWSFGMKAHVGVHADGGAVHSLETTTAKVHDNQVWDELLHGGETSVWADKGYVSADREAAWDCQGSCAGDHDEGEKGPEPWPSRRTFWTGFWRGVTRRRLSAATVLSTS